MNTRMNIIDAGQSLIGSKGFNAVGLSEILRTAGVPRGSFYHFFRSKDAFGVAVLEAYFEDYHAEMAQLFARPGLTAAERLMLYFSMWRENQTADGCAGRCLVVKLGAEVSDFSDAMRLALDAGTEGIIAHLTQAIEDGVTDGSVRVGRGADVVAATLYTLWLGASVMVKILRSTRPFDEALEETRAALGLAPTYS